MLNTYLDKIGDRITFFTQDKFYNPNNSYNNIPPCGSHLNMFTDVNLEKYQKSPESSFRKNSSFCLYQ